MLMRPDLARENCVCVHDMWFFTSSPGETSRPGTFVIVADRSYRIFRHGYVSLLENVKGLP